MKSQKNILLIVIALFVSTFANAQNKPASSGVETTAKINSATISIKYSSPSVKGRVIWGGLVPLNVIWRAGANDATTFETDKELNIEGSKLPAGKYSFFVIPSEKECILIFNKIAKQWGAYKYNDKEDQLRVTVKQQLFENSTESLTYTINSNSVVLSWEKWNIPFSVQ